MSKVNEFTGDNVESNELQDIKPTVDSLRKLNKLAKEMLNDPVVAARRAQYLKDHPKNENF